MIRGFTKETLPISFGEVSRTIEIIVSKDGTDYWNVADLSAFRPGARYSNFRNTKTVDNFVNALNSTILSDMSDRIDLPGGMKQHGAEITKEGKGGGTWVHRLLAMRYAAFLSPNFEVYIYKCYDEMRKGKQVWDKTRLLTRYESHLLTDSVQDNVIPEWEGNERYAYAREMMLINRVVFGTDKIKNVRDKCTSEQLTVISHLQRLDASLLDIGMDIEEREERMVAVMLKKFPEIPRALPPGVQE